MDKHLWELFKMTGDLRYYILLKGIEKPNGDREG